MHLTITYIDECGCEDAVDFSLSSQLLLPNVEARTEESEAKVSCA